MSPEDILSADLPVVHCATCGEKFLRPEDLEVHAERHRQVVTREREKSVRCPKGCGRSFLPEDIEKHVHEALCDGSPPLKSRTMPNRWWCEEHSYGTNGPSAWGLHKKEHHGGKDPMQEGRAPSAASAFDKAVSILKAEKVKLEKELRRVDAALKAIEKSVEVAS